MDISTGRLYESREDALAAGVPSSDIAELTGGALRDFLEGNGAIPEVRFSKGPLKGRVYKRAPNGQLVRMRTALK